MIPTWGAAFGANAIFNSAEFRADLTHSAIPDKAAPGTTGTLTRATTKTWPNNDGNLVTGVAGEIGFTGARRVDNLIRLGAAQSSTLAVAANVTMTLPAGAYQFSMGAGTGTATFSGTGGATGTLAASASARTFVAKTISAGTLIVTASVATLVDIQVVSMVAETDQTTIREYVSVGVESAPYYHSSFVDGVKCFPYDLSGNPIAASTLLGYSAEGALANVLIQSNSLTTTWTNSGGVPTQDQIGPDGATSAWTVPGVILQAPAATLTAATYTLSFFIKKTTGSQATYPVVAIYLNAGTTSAAAVTVDTTNGIVTAFTAITGFTGVNGSATCVSYSSSFWRVALTFTGTVAAYRVDVYGASTVNPTQSTGALGNIGGGNKAFYGFQLELGSFASSYIATTTIAVTRNADVLYYSGGDIASIKTLSATARREVGVSSVGAIAVLSDGTLANRTGFYLNSATQDIISGQVSSVDQWSIITSNAYTPGTFSKNAESFAANDIKASKDGVTQTPDVAATIPTVSRLEVGVVAGANQLDGTVKGIYGWSHSLSQSELNAVSAL